MRINTQAVLRALRDHLLLIDRTPGMTGWGPTWELRQRMLARQARLWLREERICSR